LIAQRRDAVDHRGRTDTRESQSLYGAAA